MAVTQGAWAQNFDKWDGVTYTTPRGWGNTESNECAIFKAAELAWVMEYYSYKHIPGNNITGIEPAYANFKLYADLDMTAGNWKPFGFSPNRSENKYYCRTFDGQGQMDQRTVP